MIPSLDHLTHSDGEDEGLLSGLVEDLLVGKGTHVLHRALSALDGGATSTNGDILVGNVLTNLLHLTSALLRLLGLGGSSRLSSTLLYLLSPVY